jgi:hypothetical protein
MRNLQPVCLLWISTLTLTMPAIAQDAAKGSRYDDQIQQEVEKLLRGRPQFNGLTARTEDQIVTLEDRVKTLHRSPERRAEDREGQKRRGRPQSCPGDDRRLGRRSPANSI